MKKELNKSFLLFVLVSTIIVIFLQKFIYEPAITTPESDAYWYIDYSLGLDQYQTFGNSRTDYTPSNVVTPLYPAYLSLILKLDRNLAKDFLCLLKNKKNTTLCSIDLTRLVWFQVLLAILTFWSIWLIAFELFKSRGIAWVSFFIALFMGRIMHFANLVLTESLIMCLFSLFSLMLVKFIFEKKTRWLILAISFLSLLILTKPSYNYLYPIIAAIFFSFLLIKPNYTKAKNFIIVILVYLTFIGPWMIRNYLHFDDMALSSGYGDRVLATRVSYNDMSWKEWAVGFIYWFPDSGDNIAKKIFSKKLYEKLSFDENSYYSKSRDVIPTHLNIRSTDERIRYLIKNEIIGDITKHNAVTLVLAWRGMFIAKYWGVLGFICFIILLVKLDKKQRNHLLLISLPAWYMVFFHAFFSLNIARYNLTLTPIYSISIAYILCSIISFSKIKLGLIKKPSS